MSLKLYGANVCPFVHRVRLVLAEKQVDHEYVAIDLRHKPDWYHRVLPTGRVPLLEHNGSRIWESSILCEYLEDAFATPALLSSSPIERAEVRLFIDWSSTHIVSGFYKLLSAQDPVAQEQHKEALTSSLREFDTRLGQKSGPFLQSRLSLADFEIYPWFERWAVLEHYRAFPLPENLENLKNWLTALEASRSVKGLRESDDFIVEQYRDYAVGERVPT